ncbi:hypothetical protein [Nonomuraea sp. NPDC052265]|uniref:hypothetical protein n=1 Tax=Nonomuraea sp. NPDC052265 TaxID=3364374 RepID=UPI0037C8A692
MNEINPTDSPESPDLTVTATYTRTLDVNGWKVVAVWRNDSPGPVELHITPGDETDPQELAGITTGTLRSIPLTEITREAREVWEATANMRGLGRSTATVLRAVKDAIETEPRPGRAGRPDAFYVAIAFLYVVFSLQGHKAIQRLAEACGVERRTAENWVNHARDKRGMLTASLPGKAGGQLTPKAQALLADANEEEN